jgi:Fe-S cluster biogenesis protein NfuA
MDITMTTPSISVVSTPNPDAYVFQVQENLIASGTYEYLKGQDASSSPLAQQLLPLEGIELIMIAPRFITVRKHSNTQWHPLAENVAKELNAFLLSGDMAVIETQSSREPISRNEIEELIIEIINEEIRPAIAQDGGDVVYHGFENGIVKLELLGACGTCPSSTVTLYHGIQNLLMEEIPEVEGIEQIHSEPQID